MGFFVICSGVVLLQLSKSAKDVPDTAVFKGDLDQVRTIAEQEQPEYEPKADSIRGAAAIVRRISTVRQKTELDEARRLHEEHLAALEPIGENEQFEWDGLRRRRTTVGTRSTMRSRGSSTVHPFPDFSPATPTPHPPLGMSRFPEDDESDHDEESRPGSASLFSTIRRSIVGGRNRGTNNSNYQPSVQSPLHPVPLTEIAVPGIKHEDDSEYSRSHPHTFGLPPSLRDQKTEYLGAGERHIHYADEMNRERSASRNSSLHPPPTPPPHTTKRQFSFQNILRKSQQPQVESPGEGSSHSHHRLGLGRSSRKSSHNSTSTRDVTEEERLGLVKGDTSTGREPNDEDPYERGDEDDYDSSGEEDWTSESKPRYHSPPREPGSRGLTPPKQRSPGSEEEEKNRENGQHEQDGWNGSGRGGRGPPTPFGGGRRGAFI